MAEKKDVPTPQAPAPQPTLSRVELAPPAPEVVPAGEEKKSFSEPRGLKLNNPDPNKTPTAPLAAGTPAPRVCHQSERAPEGLTRFKIYCDNYHPMRTRYILARTAEEARAFYLDASGLVSTVGRLKEKRVRDVEEPGVVVKAMPD